MANGGIELRTVTLSHSKKSRPLYIPIENAIYKSYISDRRCSMVSMGRSQRFVACKKAMLVLGALWLMSDYEFSHRAPSKKLPNHFIFLSWYTKQRNRWDEWENNANKESAVTGNSVWRETEAFPWRAVRVKKTLTGRYDCLCGLPLFQAKRCFQSPRLLCTLVCFSDWFGSGRPTTGGHGGGEKSGHRRCKTKRKKTSGSLLRKSCVQVFYLNQYFNMDFQPEKPSKSKKMKFLFLLI